MRRFTTIVICVFALCATTPFASAEGLRDRDPNLSVTKKISTDLQGSSLHSGSFYFISRLQLQDIGYDPHFYFPSDNNVDIRFAINAPQHLYWVPSRKFVASVMVAPSGAYSARRHKVQTGFTSRADAQFIFNHIWLDFYKVLLNDLRAKTGEINSVVTAKESEQGLNGEYKYSSRTGGTYSVLQRETSFPTKRLQPVNYVDVVPLLDRKETNYRFTFKHATFPVTTLRLAAEAADYEFKRTRDHNSRRIYLALGAAYDRGPTVANVEVGRETLNASMAGVRDFSGVIGNGTLSRRLGARTLLSVNAARDVDFSVFVNNLYYIGDRLGAAIDYDATRRLKLRVMAQHGRDLYDVPVGGIRRKDTLSFDGVGWNYSRRHIQGGFDVGYYQRKSTLGIDEGHGIRFLLHLSLAL